MQEHQWILTNATISKDSDSGFLMVVYEHFVNSIFKYLRAMKKYVSKLIFHKNLIKKGDPNYVGSFLQYIRMAVVFTNFNKNAFQ